MISKPSFVNSEFQNKAFVAFAALSENWFLDSVATSHVTHDLQYLSLYQP